MFERMDEDARAWIMDAWRRVERDAQPRLTGDAMIQSVMHVERLRRRIEAMLEACGVEELDLDATYERAKRKDAEVRDISMGMRSKRVPPFVPIANDAWSAIRCAETEADALLRIRISPEHLVLGLIRHSSGSFFDEFRLKFLECRNVVCNLLPPDQHCAPNDERADNVDPYALAVSKLGQLSHRVSQLQVALSELRVEA